jgi:hypothetical protein
MAKAICLVVDFAMPKIVGGCYKDGQTTLYEPLKVNQRYSLNSTVG